MQVYQVPHHLAETLLGPSYAATLHQALLLLPLPGDCPEPSPSEVHQADAAAASHSSQLSSPPALQGSDNSASPVPETATLLESRDSAALPRDAHAPKQHAQQEPKEPQPHAPPSMVYAWPTIDAEPVTPALADDVALASPQSAAALPVALPMDEHPSDPQHAGTESAHGQGQHAGRQQGIAAVPAPGFRKGTHGEHCSGREELRQARCAVLVPCCEAVHGRFPLNGTYFQTNEVFLDASSLERPVMVSQCGSLETR